MALDIASKYPGKSNAATAAYPFGSARNITTPGDGTGTPLEEAWLNDLFGFQQELLASSGAEPNGAPDEVGSSQYVDAIRYTTVGNVQNIGALRATEPGRRRAVWLNEHTSGGVGGGLFYFDADDTTSADDNGVTIVTPGGARWKRRIDGYVNLEMFGSIESTPDNSEIYDSARRVGVRIVTLNRTYLFTSGITYDLFTDKLVGLGTVFDFTGIADGTTAILVTNTSTVTSGEYRQTFKGFDGIRFVGPAKSGTTVGIDFYTEAEPGPSHVSFRDCGIENFGTNLQFRNNSYLLNFYNWDVFDSTTAVSMPLGGSNYGENIRFIGCQIFNSDLAIYNNNPNGHINLIGTSLDYNAKQIHCERGRVTHTDGHTEADSYLDYPFEVGANNGATIAIRGGWLLCTGTNTQTICNVPTTVRRGGGIFIDDVFVNNMGSSAKWKDGTGRFRLRVLASYDTQNNPTYIGDNENIFTNTGGGSGNAKQAADAFISSDTATVTNRRIGTNVTIEDSTDYAYDGTKSMKITKIASGSAVVAIAAPLRDDQSFVSLGLRYKKTDVNTGDAIFAFGYARIGTENGVDKILRSDAVGSVPVTFTSAAVDWTQVKVGEPLQAPPRWASHAIILVNLNGWADAANSPLYIDDIYGFEF